MGIGQFCDWGHSYIPVIYYGNEEEEHEAKASKRALELLYPDKFDGDNIAVLIEPASKFWEAEDYHQNYYIVDEEWYQFYKGRCQRVNRLGERAKRSIKQNRASVWLLFKSISLAPFVVELTIALNLTSLRSPYFIMVQ